MSGITDNAAAQAHDIVEQAETEEQRIRGNGANTGERVQTAALEANNTSGSTSDQHAHDQNASKLGKVKEALHLSK